MSTGVFLPVMATNGMSLGRFSAGTNKFVV